MSFGVNGTPNANQLCNSFDAVFIRNLLSSNSLQLVPHGATYHRDSGTWLALCIIDKQDTLLDYWKPETPFIDNHSIITATIDVSVPKFIAKPFSYFDFKSANNNDLVAYLRSCDWTVASDSPESRLSVLNSNLSSAMNRLVPLKTIKPTKYNHLWFIPLHKNLISERLFRRYRRTRLPVDLLHCRQARDHAHKIIQSSRLEYYYTRLSNITDPSLLWKELRHLGVVPPKAECPHDFSSEQLNEYFCSVLLDPRTPSIEEYLTELQSKELSELFFLKEIETLDVTAAVNHFSTQSRGRMVFPNASFWQPFQQ